jgi:hypothetical protein
VQTYALENAGDTVTYAQLNFAGTSSASEFGLGSDHNTGTLVTFVP